jgi:hypothetical protein
VADIKRERKGISIAKDIFATILPVVTALDDIIKETSQKRRERRMDGHWSGHGNEECGPCHTGFVLQPVDNHIVSKRTSAGCRMQVSDKSKIFPTEKKLEA